MSHPLRFRDWIACVVLCVVSALPAGAATPTPAPTPRVDYVFEPTAPVSPTRTSVDFVFVPITTTATVSATVPADWLIYIPSNGLFSVTHPKTWHLSAGEALVFSPSAGAVQDLSRLSGQPVVALMPADLIARDQTPAQALRTWLESLSINWEDKPDVEWETEAQVDGHSAGAAFVTGVDRETGIQFRLYMLIFDLAGERLMGVAVAPHDRWDEFWPTMKRIVDSLHALAPRAPSSRPTPPSGPHQVVADQVVAVRSAGNKVTPTSIAVGPDGRLYLLDTDTDRVRIYDATGKYVSAYLGRGAGLGQLMLMRQGSLAVGLDGKVYIADRGNKRVQVFDAKLMLERELGPDPLRSPNGVAVDASGRVYVTDDETRSVHVFDSEGKYVIEYTYQVEERQTPAPKGIAVGPKDQLYIADTVAQRVVVLDHGGELARTIGQVTDERTDLNWPMSVAVDSVGNVYVADTEAGQVKLFDLQGEVAAVFAGDRDHPLRPSGLALVGDDVLWVSDAEHGNLVRFRVPPHPAQTDPRLRLVNASFADGLTGWRMWIEPDPQPPNETSITALPDADGAGPALELKRLPNAPGIGGTGVYQPLDIPAEGLPALHLGARLMILLEEGDNIGGVRPDMPPEGAVMLRLTYRDKDGGEGEWMHGFYSRSVAGADPKNFTTVPLEQWYDFSSDNLLAEIPNLAAITRLDVFGRGRLFTCRIASVGFSTEKP